MILARAQFSISAPASGWACLCGCNQLRGRLEANWPRMASLLCLDIGAGVAESHVSPEGWPSCGGSSRICRSSKWRQAPYILSDGPKQITWPSPESVWEEFPKSVWLIRGPLLQQSAIPLLLADSFFRKHLSVYRALLLKKYSV